MRTPSLLRRASDVVKRAMSTSLSSLRGSRAGSDGPDSGDGSSTSTIVPVGNRDSVCDLIDSYFASVDDCAELAGSLDWSFDARDDRRRAAEPLLLPSPEPSPVEDRDDVPTPSVAAASSDAAPADAVALEIPDRIGALCVEASEFVDDIDDIFKVGSDEKAESRWRSKLDVTVKFDAHLFADELLSKRAYHARHTYELTLLVEICDKDWISRWAVKLLRDVSLVELRASEIRIAAFQLGMGVVGIRRADAQTMYKCAVFAHGLHLYLYDAVADMQNVKKGRKDVLAEKPVSTDTPRQLATCIDTQVFACQLMLDRTLATLKSRMTPESVFNLARRMTLLVKALDEVLHVFAEGENTAA